MFGIRALGVLWLLFFGFPALLWAQDCKDWLVYEYPVVSTGPVTIQDTVVTQAIRTVGRKINREKDQLEIWVYQNENKTLMLYLGRNPKFREKDINRLVGLRFSDGIMFRDKGESRYPIPSTSYLEYHYLIQPLTEAQLDHLLHHSLRVVDMEIHTGLETQTHSYHIEKEEAERLRQSLRCMMGLGK